MSISKIIISAVFTAAFSLASAGEIKAYDQSTFDLLAKAGKAVVVAVHAGWCPTCKAQKPIQSELMAQPAYKDVTLLNLDFDSQKPLLKQFKVAMQSTMIAFRSGKEVARSVGDTTRDGIEGLVKKSLN